MAVRGVYSNLEKEILAEFNQIAETRWGWQKPLGFMGSPGPASNPVITIEAIKKYGLETDRWNPFWYMEAYAAASRFGGIYAHPWYGSIYKPDEKMMPTRKGLFRTFYLMGHDIQYFQPIRPGDSIRTWCRKPTLEDSTDLSGKGPRKFRYVDGWGDMINQRNELVYTEKQFVEVTLNEGPIVMEKYLEDYGYTQEELEFMASMVEAEKPRGNQPRFWEDVKVGEKIQPICWGPTEFISMGTPPLDLNRMYKREFTRYEEQLGGPIMFGYVQDKKNGLIYPTHGGRHTWDRAAQAEGASRAWIFNFESRLPMTRAVTNWMSDDGFMCKFSWRHVWRTPVGDTILVNGKVVRKYEENGEKLVDVRVWCLNLRGSITDMSLATVKLPSREGYPNAPIVINR